MNKNQTPSRRNFIKTLLAGASLSIPPYLSAKTPDRKPNVIIIFADDQGSVDMNCYGSKDLVTPHMDSIAKKGTRFTQFYSGAPVCSPSRASLLSGKTAVSVGVPGNIPPGAEGMYSKTLTIAEFLKKAGYKTAHIGKWHLGEFEETKPNAQGFDYSFGHLLGCIDNYSHFFYWNGPNRHNLFRNGKEIHMPGQFFPDLMVNEACDYIEKNKKEPFFIYFAMNTPHYPYQGSEKWLEHYKDLKYPRNLYAAFISTMDDRIGKLLAKIKETGLEKDTIIIYQSDNGHSMEQRAHFGGGSAGIYSGCKASLLEGGIRVPALISWPKHLPENKVQDQLAWTCDWFPTIAELCNIPLPDVKFDGSSLVPIMKSKKAKRTAPVMLWHLGKNIKKIQWAVREKNWKLVNNPKTRDKGMYLYDISQDPGENNDLIKKHPEIAEKLKKYHHEWIDSINND